MLLKYVLRYFLLHYDARQTQFDGKRLQCDQFSYKKYLNILQTWTLDSVFMVTYRG